MADLHMQDAEKKMKKKNKKSKKTDIDKPEKVSKSSKRQSAGPAVSSSSEDGVVSGFAPTTPASVLTQEDVEDRHSEIWLFEYPKNFTEELVRKFHDLQVAVPPLGSSTAFELGGSFYLLKEVPSESFSHALNMVTNSDGQLVFGAPFQRTFRVLIDAYRKDVGDAKLVPPEPEPFVKPQSGLKMRFRMTRSAAPQSSARAVARASKRKSADTTKAKAQATPDDKSAKKKKKKAAKEQQEKKKKKRKLEQ